MKNIDAEYLFGGGEPEIRPAVPYAEECCGFLDALSKALRSDEEAKRYPELLTFAFWIRKANIQKLKEEFYRNRLPEDGSLQMLGKGLVFHIAPSNVPVNFAYTLVFGMLAGNANVVRASSKRFPQTAIVCRVMEQVAKRQEFQWVRKQNAVVMYDRTREDLTDYLSGLCDVRVIWGGDATIAQIRKSPLAPRSTEITFADRYSFAVMAASEVLQASTQERTGLAEQFYNDTYLMDQNACSSPHLVCWMGTEEEIRQASAVFWDALYQVCRERYELADVKASEKYTMLCELATELTEAEVERYENLLYVVRLEELPERITALRGRFGMFFEYHLRELEELCRHIDKKVQTCAVYGINPKAVAGTLVAGHVQGVDRIVPVGQTLDIGTVWDGYDVVGQLARYIKA